MASFHFRATCTGQIQDQIVDFLARNSQGETIICREFATNEHIHALIHIDITKKSFCNKFKTKFNTMKGNKDYSIEEVKTNDDNMAQYICKGESYLDQPIILYKLRLRKAIEEYHSLYWEHNVIKKLENEKILNFEEISQIPTLEVFKKEKKKRTPTFMMLCRDELIELYGENYDWEKNDLPKVFHKVMTKLGDLCKTLDHVIITRMVYGVLNSLIKDKKEWHEYWFQKCFPEYQNPYHSIFHDI